MANVGPPRSSGSQLPWLVGGGCAGLLLLSLALVALAMCVVGTIMLRRNNQAPQSVQLKTPAVQPGGHAGSSRSSPATGATQNSRCPACGHAGSSWRRARQRTK